jgi:hypothetical protein
MAFACAAINLKDILQLQPKSRLAKIGPPLLIISVASGLAFVAATQMYYIDGTANVLRRDDPIGKEAGFAGVVDAAEAARQLIGARWFATTDYRTYAMLRWHLRTTGVPVVQVNERSRFTDFVEPVLEGSNALYVAPRGAPDAKMLALTSATLQTVGKIDLTWRGTTYDTYVLQQMTDWTPVLSPPSDDPFARARPH